MNRLVIDERRGRQLMDEAYRRGCEYLPRWRACAPAAFAAIMDTLGYSDDPAVLEIWKATIGLTGGTGFMTVGTCGAVASAAAAISLSFNYNREDIEDLSKMMAVNLAAADIGERIKKRFGGIQCQEIQFNMWGKAFRLTSFESLAEFRAMAVNEAEKPQCREVVGLIARMTIEKILQLNPQFCKR